MSGKTVHKVNFVSLNCSDFKFLGEGSGGGLGEGKGRGLFIEKVPSPTSPKKRNTYL
jgi:hypothetical protein